MTVAWPAISTVQSWPIQTANVDLRENFQPDIGWAKTMVKATETLSMVQFDMVLTGAELSNFYSWWEVDLQCGSDDFTGLEGVVGDSPSRYLFREAPRWQVLRGGNANNRLWRATFSLWRMSGAVDAEAGPVTYLGEVVTYNGEPVIYSG